MRDAALQGSDRPRPRRAGGGRIVYVLGVVVFLGLVVVFHDTMKSRTLPSQPPKLQFQQFQQQQLSQQLQQSQQLQDGEPQAGMQPLLPSFGLRNFPRAESMEGAGNIPGVAQVDNGVVLASVSAFQPAAALAAPSAQASTVSLVDPNPTRRGPSSSHTEAGPPPTTATAATTTTISSTGPDNGNAVGVATGTPPLASQDAGVSPHLHKLDVTNGGTALARAQGSNPQPLVDFARKPLCPKAPNESTREYVAQEGSVALIAVSHKTPRTLEHSMKSWNDAGLLNLVDEKILWLNAATDAEKDLGRRHGFTVLTPTADHPHVHDADSSPSLFIGPSLFYAMRAAKSKYVLFLEKDFAVQEGLGHEALVTELQAAVQALESGVDLVRLRSASDSSKAGSPDCCRGGCSGKVNGFSTRGVWQSMFNWMYIFCKSRDSIEKFSKERINVCADTPVDYLCFDAGDSNWSNNAAMFNRTWLHDNYLADWAQRDSAKSGNGMFELNMLVWQKRWKPTPKICQSMNGPFVHREIDG